jgi:hypothetical protein
MRPQKSLPTQRLASDPGTVKKLNAIISRTDRMLTSKKFRKSKRATEGICVDLRTERR